MKAAEIEVGTVYAVSIPEALLRKESQPDSKATPEDRILASNLRKTRPPHNHPEWRLGWAKATAVATAVPHGRTNAGVLLDVVTYRPRYAGLMPGTTGFALEADDDGNAIYDEYEVRVVLAAAQVYKPWAEAVLEFDMSLWERQQEDQAWKDGHRFATKTPLILLVDVDAPLPPRRGKREPRRPDYDVASRYLYHHSVCVLAEQSEAATSRDGVPRPLGNPCPLCFPQAR